MVRGVLNVSSGCTHACLAQYPLRTAHVCAGSEALDFIRSGTPADVMLLDIRMPVMSGTDVVEAVKDALPPYPIVRTCHGAPDP